MTTEISKETSGVSQQGDSGRDSIVKLPAPKLDGGVQGHENSGMEALKNPARTLNTTAPELAWEIRLARQSDLAQLCDLYKQLDTLHVHLLPDVFKTIDGPARTQDFLSKLVTSPEGQRALFVATVEDQVVGFIDARRAKAPRLPMFIEKEHCSIDNLIVTEEFRGSGLAQQLFETAKEWARKQGIPSIQLHVYDANVAAVAFYKKLGFSPVSSNFELPL